MLIAIRQRPSSRSGENAYYYAALKSIPFVNEEAEADLISGQSEGGRRLASSLREQCTSMLKGIYCDLTRGGSATCTDDDSLFADCATTLQEDEKTLQGVNEERAAAAITYRIERKKLIIATKEILELYLQA